MAGVGIVGHERFEANRNFPPAYFWLAAAEHVRIKRSGPFMHLRPYEVDGELLRTGSANFSEGGEMPEDNDLIVIRDAGAAAKFEAHFERMWEAARPMIEFDPAIRALEPK